LQSPPPPVPRPLPLQTTKTRAFGIIWRMAYFSATRATRWALALTLFLVISRLLYSLFSSAELGAGVFCSPPPPSPPPPPPPPSSSKIPKKAQSQRPLPPPFLAGCFYYRPSSAVRAPKPRPAPRGTRAHKAPADPELLVRPATAALRKCRSL
jgi:hypothetical protein